MSTSFDAISRSRTQSCPEYLLIKESKKYGRSIDDFFFKENVYKYSVMSSPAVFSRSVELGDQQSSDNQDLISFIFLEKVQSNQSFSSPRDMVSPQDLLKIATQDHMIRTKKVAQEMARLDQGSPEYFEELQKIRRKAYQGLEAQRYEDVLENVRERSSTF